MFYIFLFFFFLFLISTTNRQWLIRDDEYETMKSEYNMEINKAKTKVLVCSRNEGPQTQMALDGDTLEQ